MIPCIVVVVLVIGFITWGLIISGGSFKQFSKIVSEGHYVCFFGHDYLDPNCKHGYLCKECGYETGEKGDHEWVEASCSEPKTCTVCKLTEGEKLGHTTGLGKCTRCYEYVYDLQSEYIDICEAFVDALSDIDSAIDYYDYGLDSYYSSQTYYKWAARDFRDAASDIQIAINACGNYSEFSKIKTHLQSAKNSISKIEGNYNSLYTYGNQVLDYVEKARTEILKYEYAMDSDDL